MSEPKKVDRRKFIYAGLGAVALVAIGAAAYIAMNPPVVTQTVTTSTTVPTTSVVTTTVPTTSVVTTTVPTTSQKTYKYTIKYLGPKAPDPTPIGASEYGLDLLQKWQDENDTKFEPEVLAWIEVEPKETTELVAGGYSRDVIYMCTWQAKFSNFVHDLNKFIPSTLKEDIPPSTLDTNTYPKGHLNSVHLCLSLLLLFYNRKIFSKAGLDPYQPPESWSDLVRMGQQIKDRLGIYPYAGINMGGDYIADWGFVHFLNQTGATFFDEDLYPGFINDAGKRALQFMQDLLIKYKIMDPASLTYQGIEDNTRAFETGTVAMTPNWTFQYTSSLNPEHSSIVGDAWMTILPGDDSVGIRSGSMDGQDTLGIPLTSKNPELAFKYIQFHLSPEAQKAMALAPPEKGGGWMPIRKSVLADPEIQTSNPVAGVLLEQAKYKSDARFPPEWSAIKVRISPIIRDCVKGDVTPTEALKNIETIILEEIKKSRGSK